MREITDADLAKLSETRDSKPANLKSLRDAHHRLARLIAQGLKSEEISLATGYSISRISILKADPAFTELVAFYRSEVAVLEYDAMAESVTKAGLARNLALDKMIETLEEDKASIGDALDIFKVTADRTGMGPQTKSTNVNVNVDLAARIEAGRRRVAQLGATAGVPLLDGKLPGAAPLSAVQVESPSDEKGGTE